MLSLQCPGSLFLALQSYSWEYRPSPPPPLRDSTLASLPLLLWRGRICWGGSGRILALVWLFGSVVFMGGVTDEGLWSPKGFFFWFFFPLRDIYCTCDSQNCSVSPGPQLTSSVTSRCVSMGFSYQFNKNDLLCNVFAVLYKCKVNLLHI